MTTIEHRFVKRAATLSVPPGVLTGPGEFAAQAVTYNVPDTYMTTWAPGCFNAGLADQLPTVLYGHDSTNLTNVLGRVVDWQDQLQGLLLVAQLDLNDAVPLAAQAYAQLQSGTLRGVSVGFIREDSEPDPNFDGCTLITRATMCEISLVIEPAVPGAQVLAVRNRVGRRRQVDEMWAEVGRIFEERGL